MLYIKLQLYYYLKLQLFIWIYVKNVIHCGDGKAEFLAAITPIFSVTWTFRNHSNMMRFFNE